jgi:hypothetical protein
LPDVTIRIIALSVRQHLQSIMEQQAHVVVYVSCPARGNLDSIIAIVRHIRDKWPVFVELGISQPKFDLSTRVNLLTVFNNTGRVLSPTTFTMPFAFHALNASPL